MTSTPWKYTDEQLINALDDNTKQIMKDEANKGNTSFMNYIRGLYYLSPFAYLFNYSDFRTAWVAAGYLQKINDEE